MDSNQSFKVTRAEALELLFRHWPLRADTEWISLAQAVGRVTARDIYARNTLPVYRCSRADGIAVRAADFTNGRPDTTNWVEGREYVRADTGADFPDDFDTVIPVEQIDYADSRLCFADGFLPRKGDCIREKGSLVKKGELLAGAHVRLTPVDLAVLAAGGIHRLEVLKKPRVVFIPTGDELIPAGIKPARGQNVEANSVMVSGFLHQWGAETICYPIIKDNPEELDEALAVALAIADIVLINGGSSKGAADFNPRLLRQRGSFFRHGIRMRPGRPMALAVIRGKPVINVPGPVMAAFLAMDWCVRGLVHHYYGLAGPERCKVRARLQEPLRKSPDIEVYNWLALTKQGDAYTASPLNYRLSIPQLLVRADALFIAPIGVAGYRAGEEVDVELLRYPAD